MGLLDRLRGCEATLAAGDDDPEPEIGFVQRLSLRFWLARKRIIWFVGKIGRRDKEE